MFVHMQHILVYGDNETFKIDTVIFSISETYCSMSNIKIERYDPLNGTIVIIDTNEADVGGFVIKSGNVKITITANAGDCQTSKLLINGVSYTAPVVMYPAKNAKIQADFFSQLETVVNVETTTAINIGAAGATIGGIVTSTGVTILSRGSCWVTPETTVLTTTNCLGVSVDGSGTGTFSKNISGLTSGVIYYHRAYAVTDGGTIYGEIKSFFYGGDFNSNLWGYC